MGRRRALNRSHVDRDPGRIEGMFDRIVPRYDAMNRIMTLGLDRRWRAMAAAEADVGEGDAILDVCCGTGDLAITLADMHPECRIVGLDFSRAMLGRAHAKASGCGNAARESLSFVRGDLLHLPFADGEFAAVTVGWGLRNVNDLGGAIAEMIRVTRPGGRVICLEMTFAQTMAGRVAYGLWLERVVPVLGRIVGGDAEAYAYLPASVEAFPRAPELAAIMRHAGLNHVRYRLLALDCVAIHVGSVTASKA